MIQGEYDSKMRLWEEKERFRLYHVAFELPLQEFDGPLSIHYRRELQEYQVLANLEIWSIKQKPA